jgi:DnaK suppressor protein
MPKVHKASETDGTDVKQPSPATTDEQAGHDQPARAATKAAAVAKKAPAGPAAGRKAPAKATSGAAKTAPATTKASGDHVRKVAPATLTAATAEHDAGPAAATAPAEDEQPDGEFLLEQQVLLVKEREGYVRQAEELKAEADSLALEHEPGDVQFDEEGGEGGTSNVDRELDLVLSAQARSAILEIDRALVKIEAGTYGRCEQCGRPIPQARLQALPYAALCVACKSGGLSRR